MSEFYDIDSTKVTTTEYLYESKVLGVIGLVIKWLRIRIPGSTDDPNVDSTLGFLAGALPPNILEAFNPASTALTTMGFQSPVYHIISDPVTHTTRYWATYQHISGVHYARIHYRFNERAPNPRRKPFVFFFTEFLDGRFIVSSNGKPDMLAPGSIDSRFKPNAPIETTWAWHQQRVADSGRRDFGAVQNRDGLLWSIERHHILLRDFHLARGVFRVQSESSKAQAQAHAQRIDHARASGFEYPEVMAHLNDLQEKKPGWSKALWVLVISAILFVAAGRSQWDWTFTLWLIPVLFFHEAGHWLAMRVFKYRNLRMFFIPFFGAAVTGQNWNVPGWKKAIVSLAGPIPGVLLGCALTVVAIFVNQPWLNQLALILLLLNAFNLLPILPLDGGHVLQALLFCRNRWLDGAFRVLAVLGLLALAMTGAGRLMIALVVIMALSLPLAFKLAKVADDLRGAGLPPPLPGEDKIPPQTAQTIIAAVKATVPSATSSKMVAQHTINVFETLNAHPPGVFATLVFLFVHAAGVVLSLVFGVLLIVNMHGGLGDFFKAAIRQPENVYHCGTVQSWNGSQVTNSPAEANNLLIVTLDDFDEAAEAFSSLTNRLPQSARLTHFGESLFLKLPASDDAAREKWFEELQTITTNVSVVVSNTSVAVNLTFIAPTAEAATNLTQTLDSSLASASGMNLIAPWSPDAKQPGFEAKLAARDQWQRIGAELSGVRTNSSLKELNKKMIAASKRGAHGELTALQKQYEKLVSDLQVETRQKLGNQSQDQIDPDLIELHARLEQLNYTNRVERTATFRQIAAKLGEVPYEGDQPAPNALAYSATFGSVSRAGLLIELHWLTLSDATVGLPQMADWLCEQGCSTFKYEVQPDYFSGFFDGSRDSD